jgi:MFS family permease
VLGTIDLGIADNGQRAGHEQASQIAITLFADATEPVLAPALVGPVPGRDHTVERQNLFLDPAQLRPQCCQAHPRNLWHPFVTWIGDNVEQLLDTIAPDRRDDPELGKMSASAVGVYYHTLWLIYVGYGVFGGCALGIGYISPVSTLIKWFPDRPGMATGMAIMGFGGGAFIASPLSVWLMAKFNTATHVGVMETFVIMGAIYFCFMMVGATIVRIPAPGWKPQGYVVPLQAEKLITRNDVYVYDALKTPQFWLIWWVLCLNVTAGIGVLGQASAMSQEMFPGVITPVAAAGLVGLMSLFNMGGRFCWASLSDIIGRRNTYFCFFLIGFVLYITVPYAGGIGSVALFAFCFCIIISMYGGSFSTVPAYLRDMFGTRYVGAIHGMLLTAWSAAGIFGPVLVNYIREYNVTHGVPKAQAYNTTMYIMAGLLVIGFICNFFVKAVNSRFHMTADHPADAVPAGSQTAPAQA